MDDLYKPVLGLNSTIMLHLRPAMDGLPRDPFQITLIALSNSDNITKLACCMKLVQMYHDAIPYISLSNRQSPTIDKENPKFEDDLTISKRLSPNSITTLFTCCMKALGLNALRHFINSPNSTNPFSQCMRLFFRYTWMLRCRKNALTEIRNGNQLGILSQTLRLSSFRDFAPSAQRASLFTAKCIPQKVNLRFFAYSIPKRFLTDSTRTIYEEFKELLSVDRKIELEELEIEIDRIISSKMNLPYFSGKSSIEETIVGTMPVEEIYDTPLEDLMSCFLYEIAPDHEMKRFTKDFIRAAETASTLKIEGIKKRFNLIYFVNYEELPKKIKNTKKNSCLQSTEGELSLTSDASSCSSRKRKVIIAQKNKINVFDVFRPPQDFIAENKRLHELN